MAGPRTLAVDIGGTGVKLAANGVPAGLDEPFELIRTTATTAPMISTRAPSPGSR